jgi:CheY-like chemotaxis protein/anti-sigma regulatory factor (Ser/Thr protein kinase)
MKVLVVDDDRTNLAVITAMLKRENHSVIRAENGADAVAAFQHDRPELVLMDIMMPVMDGYEATRRIKQACGESFVPVIFLTALTDENALARCVESGGDDFLTKPINRIILNAKISAMERIRSLHATVSRQRDELEKYRAATEDEFRLAKHIFNAVTTRSQQGQDCMRHWSMSVGQFSGDLLMHERGPGGRTNLMLGDFTGHGLPSAVGALPVADTFYSMTAKGFGIGDIAAEINRKLSFYLPTGRFCAACLVSLRPAEGLIEIWNGGLPELLVRGADGAVVRHVQSSKLPLGIVHDGEFDKRVETLPLSGVESLLLYSDGLIEAKNHRDEMFSIDGMLGCLEAADDAEHGFDLIRQGMLDFSGGRKPDDDVSLVEIRCGGCSAPARTAAAGGAAFSATAPSKWSFSLCVSAEQLRDFDPMPVVMDWMSKMGVSDEKRHMAYAVISELVANAIDHGLLHLDSSLKREPEGFEEFYRRRSEELQRLGVGYLKLEIAHVQDDGASDMKVRVEDTGPGFDVHAVFSDLEGNERAYGRGIALVRAMCSSVDYLGSGNTVEVRCPSG